FPSLLYQTRKGVICFAPFQHPDFNGPLLSHALTFSARIAQHDSTLLHRDTILCPNTLTPKMTSRRREPGRGAAAISPTQVPSAAPLISFDRDVPAKSSRSGDILSVITRILPAKNSRKLFLWKLDAEVPRFTFGRILQRPAGNRVASIERVI